MEIELKNYPTQILVSKKRRPKYYKFGDKIPKKYSEYGYITINGQSYLVDGEGNKVLKNVRTVGKEKWEQINGQTMYNQKGGWILRKKIVTLLHDYMIPFIPEQKFDVPVAIEFQYFGVNEKKDLDNLDRFYSKVFLDCLVEKQVIKDDSLEYVRRINKVYYEADERRLNIRIIPFTE